MSRWQYLVFVVTLASSGCGGSDTLMILQRDANAIQSEIADNLIMVVDDASAQVFLEQKVPRYKIRLTKLKDRISMWGKYADDDKKKVKAAVDAIRDLVLKDKDALRESSFEKLSEGAAYFRLMAESQASSRRLNDEARRIQVLVAKMAREHGVNPEQEWPYLYKMQDPTKEFGGGSGKSMFE